MQCTNCQAEISAKLRFCDSCGSKVEKRENQNLIVSENTDKPEKSSGIPGYLTLKVWKPLRWLLSADYGYLRIVEGHLVIKTTTTWKLRAWKMFFQLLCFGFDPASFLRFESTNQLRNLAAISVFMPTWIMWKLPFVVVRSPGFIGVFGVATETLDSVNSFVKETKEATEAVKYNLK